MSQNPYYQLLCGIFSSMEQLGEGSSAQRGLLVIISQVVSRPSFRDFVETFFKRISASCRRLAYTNEFERGEETVLLPSSSVSHTTREAGDKRVANMPP
jgi:hypothetical protein